MNESNPFCKSTLSYDKSQAGQILQVHTKKKRGIITTTTTRTVCVCICCKDCCRFGKQLRHPEDLARWALRAFGGHLF